MRANATNATDGANTATQADAPPTGTHICYQRQYRRCGKPECHCRRPEGPQHGPYWYGYWRDHAQHGKLRSFYVGKDAPACVYATAASEQKVSA